MDELHKQVRRAQRRLTMQRFVGVLGWCWFTALLLALLVIVIDKYYPCTSQPGFGWPVRSCWACWPQSSGLCLPEGRLLEAALEIDRRFALKERVSSTLAMPPEDLAIRGRSGGDRRCPEAGKTHRRGRKIHRCPAAETFASVVPAFGGRFL